MGRCRALGGTNHSLPGPDSAESRPETQFPSLTRGYRAACTMEPHVARARPTGMSLAANGARMSSLEPFQISTIADGLTVHGERFCRSFWDWYEAEPNEVVVWAQIDGVRCVDAYSVDQIRKWCDQPTATHIICLIMGRPVCFPKEYVALIPAQVDWLLGGQVGPIPGSTNNGRADE
jgi:hypothetical protein